jgi:hypothetical protein
VSLAVEVKPRRGIHVYAEGATGYRLVTVRLQPDRRMKAGRVRYPAAVIFHFVPLDERVPVYSAPFRIVQGGPWSRDSSAFEIQGTLEYQLVMMRSVTNPCRFR